MKLEQFLIERFANATRTSQGKHIELFINPSTQELKDLKKANPYGFRFIADMQLKKVFVWSNELIHGDAIDSFQKQLKPLTYSNYVRHNTLADRYFMGDVDRNGKVNSDIWDTFVWKSENTVTQMSMQVDTFETMMNYDKQWLKKYGIDPKQIDYYVDTIWSNLQ